MTVTQGAGRPVAGYRLADGTRCPSVTTITGRFKDAGGLMHWAWNEGIEGRDYKASRDKAASAGSICHDYIERWIHGDPQAEMELIPMQPELDATYAQAWQGFQAFTDWASQVQLEVLETETPLVSEEWRFGGTLDATAKIAGRLKVLLDWKTSNKTYGEYVAQIAAYRQLLRERDGLDAPVAAQLLRVGKDHADFHLHSWPESVLDIGWEWFRHARELYDLDKELKKVAA